MAQHRFSNAPTTAPSRFFQDRYVYKSVSIFDLDWIFRSPDGLKGIVSEWKLETSPDKVWKFTREIGRAMNHSAAGARWWSALIVYRTTTGKLDGELIEPITLHYEDPEGNRGVETLTFAQLDRWISTEAGAELKTVAA